MDTTTIDAVFSGGVLHPIGEVNLNENQRVRLTIAATPNPISKEMAEWMERITAHRQAMYDRLGYCHDSTELVAEERRRDG